MLTTANDTQYLRCVEVTAGASVGRFIVTAWRSGEAMSAAASAAVKVTRCLFRRAVTSTTTVLTKLPPRNAVNSAAIAISPSSYSAPRRTLSARPAEVSGDQDDDDGNGRGQEAAGEVFEERRGDLTVESKPWNPKEKRAGVLAMKVGMMPLFDQWGVRHAVTVLQLDECDVIQVKTHETDGYTSVQLGVGERKTKNVNKPMTAHFRKAGVKPKRKVTEFRVTPGALLPMGFRLRAMHFVPGQKIDACGISKGKGFQGGMKRWGFAGQRASHGVSKTHRHIGSTGQCQDPGRVFKGKKMPGRMGTDRITVQNLKVLKIDPVRELLFIKGHVPGQNGGYIRITDAVRGPDFPQDPPFPTYVPPAGQLAPTEDVWCPKGDVDPLHIETVE